MSTIPGPKPAPVVGNIPDIDPHAPVQSMMKLAREYGPILRLELPGREMLVIRSQERVNELCDEQRFDKKVHAPLQQVRDFAGDGLFTAHTQELNWGKAHRILMPVFGTAAQRNMLPSMLDIAEQMLLKWERQGPAHRIDVVDNTTRLTLDTIALWAFDYRFNSFYESDMHPFVGAMVRAPAESGAYAAVASAKSPDADNLPPVRRRYSPDAPDRGRADCGAQEAGRSRRQAGYPRHHAGCREPADRRAAERREYPVSDGHLPDCGP